MSKRCLAKNRNGKRCGAWAVVGRVKCSLHLDPERAAQMGSKHGSRTVLHSGAVLMEPPKTAGDVRDVLANTMSQVHSRKMDVRIANSLAYISTTLLRALEVSDLERRLEALERSQKFEVTRCDLWRA
jgi:two-component sensor histidine kinase